MFDVLMLLPESWDKLHLKGSCIFYDSLMCRYEEIPDVWEPPKPQPYKEQTDLYSFLMDPDAYDQYCIMTNRGSTVQIMLNSAPEPTKLQERAVSEHI